MNTLLQNLKCVFSIIDEKSAILRMPNFLNKVRNVSFFKRIILCWGLWKSGDIL